jgi:hypothetical protein
LMPQPRAGVQQHLNSGYFQFDSPILRLLILITLQSFENNRNLGYKVHQLSGYKVRQLCISAVGRNTGPKQDLGISLMETGGLSPLTKIGRWIPSWQSRLLLVFSPQRRFHTLCTSLKIVRFAWSVAGFWIAAPTDAEFTCLPEARKPGHHIWFTAISLALIKAHQLSSSLVPSFRQP